MSGFIITQITDLHLTSSDTAKRTEPRVLGALTGMNDRFRCLLKSEFIKNCDLLLVTGDVTDLGDIQSWHHFWTGIRNNGLHEKTRVILGNHDVAYLELLRRYKARTTRSEDRMRYRLGLRAGNAPEAFPWHECFSAGEVLLVALRSTQEGNVSNLTNAMGRLSNGQLDGLRKALRGSKAKYKVVTLHHPPCFPKGGRVNSFLHDIQDDEAQSFLSICQKYGAQLVIHGHMHCYMDQQYKDVRIVGAAASTEPLRLQRTKIELCRYNFAEGKIGVDRVFVDT